MNELQSGPDLRDAIVQFRHPAHNGLVGTGFVVNGRWILTCAHVVVSAGGQSGSSLEVIFHTTGEKRLCTALPEAWQAPEGNDIAVLQLVGSKAESGFQLRLGDSSGCAGHQFRAFGFAPLGQVEGVWASGEIKGRVREDNSRELLQLASAELDKGLSGSPVFDITRGYVVGMVTMVNYPGPSGKHRDTALATPAEALYHALPALGLQAMPLRELLQVEGQWRLAHLFSRPVLAGIASRLQRWQAQRPLQAALAALSVLALVVLSTLGWRAYLNRDWAPVSGGQALLIGQGGQTCHVPVEPFQIQITEVTNAAYLACVRSGQCQPPNSIWEAGPQGPIYPDGFAEHPVFGVSWADAKSYCQFSGGRLPTEAEWVRAARGGTTLAYPWSDVFDAEKVNGLESGRGDTVSVWDYANGRNAAGLYHLAGNVREWVDSRAMDACDGTQGEGDPVARGGGYLDDQKQTSLWARQQGAALPYTGLRCIRPTAP